MIILEILMSLFLFSYLILPIVLLKNLKYIGIEHENIESKRIEYFALKVIKILLIYMSIGSVIKIIALLF